MNKESIWLEQARQGDKGAFGKLIEAYQGLVFNLAYRMLSHSGEAERVVQEAFISTYARLDNYSSAYKFSTWLLSITSNYCMDQLHKRHAVSLAIGEPLSPHPTPSADQDKLPDLLLIMNEQQAMVQSLLEALAPDYRQIVILRYWYDLSYEDIAQVTDTTVSIVKSRFFRARRQLAEMGLENGLDFTTQAGKIIDYRDRCRENVQSEIF